MNDSIRILVVDDDPDILHGTARALTKAGYTVDQASNGAEALKVLQDRRPDLVLSDRDMPVMDGIELCRRIKQDPILKDTLVVIASGSFTESDAQAEGLELRAIPVIIQSTLTDRGRGFALGASDYLVKPVSNSELLRSINKYGKQKLAGSVLVVEDDPDLRESLSNQLLKQGLEPILAENGKQGIKMLEQHQISIIFTDLIMPEMDGMTFINTVHANPLWKDIPIVVMTAKDLNAEERKALGLEAQLVLEKHSMSYTDLIQYIGALITDNAPVAGTAARAEKETKSC